MLAEDEESLSVCETERLLTKMMNSTRSSVSDQSLIIFFLIFFFTFSSYLVMFGLKMINYCDFTIIIVLVLHRLKLIRIGSQKILAEQWHGEENSRKCGGHNGHLVCTLKINFR